MHSGHLNNRTIDVTPLLEKLISDHFDITPNGYITAQELKRQLKHYYPTSYAPQQAISKAMSALGYGKQRVYLGRHQYAAYTGLCLRPDAPTIGL